VTTAELDAAASEVILARGAESNFQLVRGYRHTTCISVNDQVVHGIPGARARAGRHRLDRRGAQFKGWNGDSAITVVVPGGIPAVRASRQRLSQVTEGRSGRASPRSRRRRASARSATPGLHRAVGESYGILRDYVGTASAGGCTRGRRCSTIGCRPRPRGASGPVLAIEPMVTVGSEETFVEDDDWTVTTVDGSDGSHWEHSVAVHEAASGC
jgi:methionyl aminopeptidase